MKNLFNNINIANNDYVPVSVYEAALLLDRTNRHISTILDGETVNLSEGGTITRNGDEFLFKSDSQIRDRMRYMAEAMR